MQLPDCARQPGPLHALLEIYLELSVVRELVTLEMLLDQLTDNAALTHLVVWLDERARVRNLAHKIHLLGVDPVDDCPLLVQRSLANLTWRQEEQSQQRVAIQLSQQSEGPQGLDSATEELLRQAAEFHKLRATQRTGS